MQAARFSEDSPLEFWTEEIFNNIGDFTMEDLQNFHQEHINGNDYTILVLGSKDELNLDALKEYGKVKFLALEDVFGY